MDIIHSDQEYYDQTFEKVHLMPGEIITAEFTDCKFVGCEFESVAFIGCKFSNCIFRECNLNMVRVLESSFPGTRFEQSRLAGIDWTRGSWSRLTLNQPDGFFGCVISHSTFIRLECSGIQIKDCVAHDVDFREADLSRANFEGTDLSKSLFDNTNLSRADLSDAKNYQIDPVKNTLKAAKFSLPEAMALLYSMDIEMVDSD